MVFVKGKEKVIDLTDNDSSSSSDSDSDSESVSSSGSASSDESFITHEQLEEILERARKQAEAAEEKLAQEKAAKGPEEEVLQLDDDPYLKGVPIPPLDPGKLPDPYFDLSDEEEHMKPQPGPSRLRDPQVEAVARAVDSFGIPAPPIPPPELNKAGKILTKKEKKALKTQTAGPGWFDLPAPSEADLPRLHREVESMRLRNQLDPKRFYRKEEGEGKGIKGLPKYFGIGRMVESSSPFGNGGSDNLPKSHRKRTMVDELMDDAEAKRYAKRKFNELQSVRGARGLNTLHAKKALRKQKW
ncbi:Fcf2 pre-rRNA processing-domain-containing protein [Flagelloscypha sp. PMI_526]|nr:Fcf2 pre-rRNA processing-domain-containing protein [Flagelloscypha sp. PMI_526]